MFSFTAELQKLLQQEITLNYMMYILQIQLQDKKVLGIPYWKC